MASPFLILGKEVGTAIIGSKSASFFVFAATAEERNTSCTNTMKVVAVFAILAVFLPCFLPCLFLPHTQLLCIKDT